MYFSFRIMSRLVERRQKPASGTADLSTRKTQSALNEWGERVAKYIPAEILTFYTAAVSLIAAYPSAQASKRLWLFGIAGLFFWVLTPLWLGRFSKDKSVKITNQIVGFIAFALWAYAFPA